MDGKNGHVKLFDDTFGPLGSTGCSWDELTFTDRKPKMVFRYVGWVDVMGASHMMRRSIDSAAKEIGQLHEAVLKAAMKKETNSRLWLHPLADGVYIVSKSYKTVSNVLFRVFRSYARTYLKMTSESRFCPIRAAVAYGRVVDEHAFRKRLKNTLSANGGSAIADIYLANVIHGRAYAAAHNAERHAPPFGIYHDESVREFGTSDAKNPITWPLARWWLSEKLDKGKRRDFAQNFGRRLLEHFAWLDAHPIDSEMASEDSSEKLAGYKQKIEEYFACSMEQQR